MSEPKPTYTTKAPALFALLARGEVADLPNAEVSAATLIPRLRHMPFAELWWFCELLRADDPGMTARRTIDAGVRADWVFAAIDADRAGHAPDEVVAEALADILADPQYEPAGIDRGRFEDLMDRDWLED